MKYKFRFFFNIAEIFIACVNKHMYTLYVFIQNQIFHLFTPDRILRFQRKFTAGSPDECWPWTGAKRTDGYGAMKIGGSMGVHLKAHRIARVLADGVDIPEGLVVDHTCFNKACVNPAHLEIIQQSENVSRYHGQRDPAGVCRKGHPIYRGVPCKACSSANTVAWQRANPERHREISRLSYRRRRDAQGIPPRAFRPNGAAA